MMGIRTQLEVGYVGKTYGGICCAVFGARVTGFISVVVLAVEYVWESEVIN